MDVEKIALLWYLQETLDSPENPIGVFGIALSRHSINFSPEEQP